MTRFFGSHSPRQAPAARGTSCRKRQTKPDLNVEALEDRRVLSTASALSSADFQQLLTAVAGFLSARSMPVPSSTALAAAINSTSTSSSSSSPGSTTSHEFAEQHLAGITVQPEDRSGHVLAKTVTNHQGQYTFNQLSGPVANPENASGVGGLNLSGAKFVVAHAATAPISDLDSDKLEPAAIEIKISDTRKGIAADGKTAALNAAEVKTDRRERKALAAQIRQATNSLDADREQARKEATDLKADEKELGALTEQATSLRTDIARDKKDAKDLAVDKKELEAIEDQIRKTEQDIAADRTELSKIEADLAADTKALTDLMAKAHALGNDITANDTATRRLAVDVRTDQSELWKLVNHASALKKGHRGRSARDRRDDR